MDETNNKQFDLGFLTLFDTNPLFSTANVPKDIDEIIRQKSVGNISFFVLKLINEITDLKTKRDQLPEQYQQHDFSKS